MNYKQYQYKILCEDKAHYNFVRGWLEAKDAHRRVTCYGDLPHEGSGKAFVKQNIEVAIKKVRNLSRRVKTILIVVIDADDNDLGAVFDTFSCEAQDPVFFVIPKWSIDTWARFLSYPTHGMALDETVSCKHEFRKEFKFTQLGKQLAKDTHFSTRSMPKSLRSTYENIKDKKEVLFED